VNTILIDNTISCFADNPLNGVFIPTFSINSPYEDIFLLILEQYLLHIKSGFAVFGNISQPNTEGNNWYEDLGRIMLAQRTAAILPQPHQVMDMTDD
jgi:hypothetical protein